MEALTMFGLILVVLLVPIKVAGNYLGAQRTGFGWCFLAILMAGAFAQIGEELTEYGELLSIFLSAAGFSFIMGTTYLKGLGIAVFQLVATIGLVAILALLGVGAVEITT